MDLFTLPIPLSDEFKVAAGAISYFLAFWMAAIGSERVALDLPRFDGSVSSLLIPPKKPPIPPIQPFLDFVPPPAPPLLTPAPTWADTHPLLAIILAAIGGWLLLFAIACFFAALIEIATNVGPAIFARILHFIASNSTQNDVRDDNSVSAKVVKRLLRGYQRKRAEIAAYRDIVIQQDQLISSLRHELQEAQTQIRLQSSIIQRQDREIHKCNPRLMTEKFEEMVLGHQWDLANVWNFALECFQKRIQSLSTELRTSKARFLRFQIAVNAGIHNVIRLSAATTRDQRAIMLRIQPMVRFFCGRIKDLGDKLAAARTDTTLQQLVFGAIIAQFQDLLLAKTIFQRLTTQSVALFYENRIVDLTNELRPAPIKAVRFEEEETQEDIIPDHPLDKGKGKEQQGDNGNQRHSHNADDDIDEGEEGGNGEQGHSQPDTTVPDIANPPKSGRRTHRAGRKNRKTPNLQGESSSAAQDDGDDDGEEEENGEQGHSQPVTAVAGSADPPKSGRKKRRRKRKSGSTSQAQSNDGNAAQDDGDDNGDDAGDGWDGRTGGN